MKSILLHIDHDRAMPARLQVALDHREDRALLPIVARRKGCGEGKGHGQGTGGEA